jgi:hypothetical protein
MQLENLKSKLEMIYQDEDGGVGQGVCDDHEDVKEADVQQDRCKRDHVTNQQQEQKDDPVKRFALKKIVYISFLFLK